jgi:23S rRNA pseudouridine955/2504/2580 synthase
VSEVRTVTVGQDDAETRVDRWFKRHYPGLPISRVNKLLRTGQVRVDGKRAKANQRLAAGQEIRVPPLPDDATSPDAGAPPADAKKAAEPDPNALAALQDAVLHLDDWVLALNKPAGIASQGGTHVTTSVDGLSEHLRFGAAARPKLVHRLDKDTTGVLLLGRSAEAANRLTRAFQSKDARKIYWALTAGVPKPRAGRISRPLAKLKRGGGEKMGEDPNGKPAETAYRVVAASKAGLAWVALSPLTGRTHQLRAHMALAGTPILGDGKYGGRDAFPAALDVRQLHLHARQIALPHPDDGTTLRLAADLPAHMATLFTRLGVDVADGGDADPASP